MDEEFSVDAGRASNETSEVSHIIKNRDEAVHLALKAGPHDESCSTVLTLLRSGGGPGVSEKQGVSLLLCLLSSL